MDWKSLSTQKITEVYHRLFLNHCYLCHTSSNNPKNDNKSKSNTSTICHYCIENLAHNTHCCTQCKRPTLTLGTICGQCQAKTPLYQSCHAPFRFEGIIKNLIHSIKFNQGNAYIHPLMQLLSEHLIQAYSNDHWPQQILYVPSHPKRIKERGFCQTKAMTAQLARNLQYFLNKNLLSKNLLESDNHLENNYPKRPKHNPIEKRHHTQAQHSLNRKDRLNSPKNLYRVRPPIAKHVALFDDVMTTGSTIENCTQQLLKAGAERVDIWVIARTPDKANRECNDEP